MLNIRRETAIVRSIVSDRKANPLRARGQGVGACYDPGEELQMVNVNPGMDADVFEQFIDQLQRYVRERLIPAERAIIESDRIPDDILAELRDMGLFGLTMPEGYGGAGMNVTQYVRTIHALSYAMPAFRSIISINIGMFCSALKNG